VAKLRESRILEVSLETQDEATRRAYQGRRLRETVAHAFAHAPRTRASLEAAGVQPSEVASLDALARIPITRKDDLSALDAANLPFGGLLAVPVGKLQRIFMSPGPIYDPQGAGDDYWRFRHAFAAAGFREGDVVQNSASYHLTPLGFMLDAALRSLGCVVIPAGVGQTELQIRLAADVGATGYVGTPSFLHTLLTKAREAKRPLRIEAAFVTAEMLPESLRAELEQDFSVRVLQGYGTADLGLLAYECPEKGGMHLHPECIVELLDLETGKPSAPGQPGEVVATVFDEAYPLLRFATGDLSAFAAPGPCPCGRTAPKLTGLLGRVGDAVKVKGMFIRGAQLDAAMRGFPEVARWQAVVEREGHQDQLSYLVETAAPVADEPAFRARLADALREAAKVRGEVRLVAAGTLSPTAKRIDDRRVWK
jgi:phenylacetate-CoA ligase